MSPQNQTQKGNHSKIFYFLIFLIFSIVVLGVFLSAVAWNVADSVYTGANIDVSGTELFPQGITFKPDGTKFYIIGATQDFIYQYGLTTAWDLSTASYDGINRDVCTPDLNCDDSVPTQVLFNGTGKKMYVIGAQDDQVSEYNLSTAWLLSSATATGITLNITTRETNPLGGHFKPDGSKFYVIGSANDRVLEYNLTKRWSFSGAVYNINFSVTTQDGAPEDVFFSPNGTLMFMVGSINDMVFRYTLSTAWKVTTASYSPKINFSTASQETGPRDFFFNNTGTRMYVVGDNAIPFGNNPGYVWEYSLADNVKPYITKRSPLNQTYSTTTILFNVTATDNTAISSCLYSLTGGTKNYTLTQSGASSSYNATNSSMTQGSKTVTFYCNDTSDNWNSTSRIFFIDSINPKISYGTITPANYANLSQLSIFVNTTWTELNFNNITFTLRNKTATLNTTTFTTSSTKSINFTKSMRDDNYTFFVNITDIAKNKNSTAIRHVILDKTNPKVAYDTETASNYANLSQLSIYVNVTLTEGNFKNITYTLRNKTATLNTTTFTTARKYLNFTKGIINDNYTYFVNTTDWAGNKNSTAIRHIILDTVDPAMNITNANATSGTAGSLDKILNYTVSDTYLKLCYFSLRTLGGALNNYEENTTLSCSATSKTLTTTFFGTFVATFWGEDFSGNLGRDDITFTTVAAAGTGGGGGGTTTTLVVGGNATTKTFCGDLMCQPEGNDYGLKEDYWSCNQDCPGAVGENIDNLFNYLASFCFDNDPATSCFWTQGLFATVPDIELQQAGNFTIYSGGNVCYKGNCERVSGKTLVTNCLDSDDSTPCFWDTKTSVYLILISGLALLGLSFIRVPVSGRTNKVSPYSYVKLKIDKVRRRRR